MQDITVMGGAIEESIAPTFDYSVFDPATQTAAQTSATRIHGYVGDIHDRILRIGIELTAVKTIIPKDYWCEWVKREFGFSKDTEENYRNAAMRVPDLLQERNIQLTAVYELARTKTPEHAIALAIEQAKAGVQVDYKKAYVIGRAPYYIVQKMTIGGVGSIQAYEATVEINKDCKREVFDLCEYNGVAHATVIKYLKHLHASRHMSPEWYDVSTSGKLVMGRTERVVPLGEANERDVEDYIEDRRYAAFLAKQSQETEYTVLETLASALEVEVVEDKGGEITFKFKIPGRHSKLEKGESVKLTLQQLKIVKTEAKE